MDLKEKVKIFSGVDVDKDFKHVSEISYYNNNYYTYKGHLIFGKSDDISETEYFLVSYNNEDDYIGYSRSMDTPEVIIV